MAQKEEDGMRVRLRTIVSVLAALTVLVPGVAGAQPYPSKPIRIMVGFAPGGPADVMARLIAQRLPALLAQSIVVENRPGAGGTIAAKLVAESEADGHTLLLGNTSTLVISPIVYANVGYDPAAGFAPVALLGITSNVLAVHPTLPAKTVGELIALAKASPGKLNYSSPGIGTPPHLIGELFKQRAGLDIVHVPYKGGGVASQAVIAGEVEMIFENPTTSVPLVQGGRVRGLAVTSETRNPQLPELPTMTEAGLPDFVSVSFTGVVAPGGTPRAVVERLNSAINDSIASPEISSALVKLAVESRPASAADFAAFLARERDKWGAVIRSAGLAAK
jgi:tripartite-type tricarboxylate transporter receptor subunit TctC